MLLANTKQQPLEVHSEAIAELAVCIRRHFFNPEFLEHFGITPVYLDETIYQSGLDHDIGKAAPTFQQYIQSKIKDNENYEPSGEDTRFDINQEPLHHEISYWLAGHKIDSGLLPKNIYLEAYLYAIYWHHAKPDRDNDEQDIIRDYIRCNEKAIRENLKQIGQELPTLKLYSIPEHFADKTGKVFKVTAEFNHSFDSETAPELFGSIQKRNITNTIVRLCLVLADRAISALSADKLQSALKQKDYQVIIEEHHWSSENLYPAVDAYINQSKTLDPIRHDLQSRAAEGLARFDHITCDGPPGVGKTRIALMASFLRQKQSDVSSPLIWICPRVNVCESILNELQNCLPDTLIHLKTGTSSTYICNGETLQDSEQSKADITITTIDQMAKCLLSHPDLGEISHYLSASVVFDEFHELFEQPVFTPIFHELAMLKYLQGGRNITFISGTINPLMLQLFPKEFSVPVKCPSFNSSTYHVVASSCPFGEHGEPLINIGDNALQITNYAKSAQISTLHQKKNAVIPYHSLYTERDRASLFEKLMTQCNAECTNHPVKVISGPAAQASLNISRRNGFIEIASPESTLQRVGRTNRFGEHDKASLMFFSDLEKIKNKKSLTKINNKIFIQQGTEYLAGAFHEYLTLNFKHQVSLTISELAKHYYRFHDLIIGNDIYLSPLELFSFSSAIVEDLLSMPEKKWQEALSKAEKIMKEKLQESDFITIQQIQEIWKESLSDFVQESQRYEIISNTGKELSSLTQRWRRSGQLTMLALLSKSQEAFQKNHCFEPLKKLTVNNGKTSTQLYLRGRSLYVTAPILTLYLSDENGCSLNLITDS
ncbi:CRISPR-associated endonuclease Cas3'' [Endozoicomonas sp.]|uniref:CRISPR-associated endonuclease Cas3'' n=1 Tax=Endozoicomonas sp. TaxID=1892382 RepID=UPI003AF97642